MTSQPKYSALDRLTHRIAFSNRAIQLTASDIEGIAFGKRFRQIPVEKPIFVSSMPRAGTTLILELLARSPDVASHTYRDMPFVLAPILWDTISRPFRVRSEAKERAHGDGMKVSVDSPEAFEEVLWRAFWPKNFKGRTIELWDDGQVPREFRDFFTTHIRKVLSIRSLPGETRSRYLSKNNGNIARLDLLKRLFPDCQIVVPFRNPVDQAGSLLRQHTRFLELHEKDGFSKEYMRDLGHLEFGQLHKPIGFPGLDLITDRFEPSGLDYWIGYWRVSFDHILEREEGVIFVSYEDLCRKGVPGLRRLTERLGLAADDAVGEGGGMLRAPTRYEIETGSLDKENLEAALDLHRRLRDSSLV